MQGDERALLLHACCAPCATHVIELLSQSFIVTALFYNPNIQPEDEYRQRLQAMQQLCARTATKLLVEPYDVAAWDRCVLGLENEPEHGKRCEKCFACRLEYTGAVAARRGYRLFATTLTVSPRKSAPVINAVGESVAAQAGVQYYASDFKKQNGFKRSCELSKAYNLYRQRYCGCRYSK